MESMDIYIANVPFDEGTGSKDRPALVIKVDQERVMVFKVTSQYQDKLPQIKRLYCPIKDWQQAGLKKQSYVDIHRLYRLSKKWVFSHQPIGKLTAGDCLALFNFIKNAK
ncbi:type II toxin-antitoxin system PemK/MazF family toxin [Lactobacillus bombicola]|uniref:Type II toxin-antitoxin system PemK/MazF family toxin n=1 Tax=Lactobacillus bombicola TaxID=1505723 RepID=A0A396SQP7_9LACO|nr:type II toxin-antitoxin system PemK/MazF family toxin [Lactobacillus bombicola]RHW54272.1 hypothetical protein DS835_04265 [Lactobacillus bombicola]